MSATKHNDNRPIRRWSKPKQPPISRRGREHWVVRWIGAANLRRSKPVSVATVEAPCAEIIRLSWADTFGRPMRTAPGRLFQSAGIMIPLLQL